MAKIRIIFISPYTTDPENKPRLKNFVSIFKQDIFFNFIIKKNELSNVISVILIRIFSSTAQIAKELLKSPRSSAFLFPFLCCHLLYGHVQK